jgi:hypothetical protein
VPRSIVLQVLFAYGISGIMDLPNFFIYEINPCNNKTDDDALLEKDCWSFVEATTMMKDSWYQPWIIFKTVVIRILPLLAIIVMNMMIIWKLHQIWQKKKSLFSTAADTSRSRQDVATVGVETVSRLVAPGPQLLGVPGPSPGHSRAGSR